MPYARPLLTDLIEQATQDFVAQPITDPAGNVIDGLLPIGVIPAIGMAVSGQSFEHYGYIDWIAHQAVPWTATDEYLAGWAALRRVFRKAATYTAGTLTFTGTGTTDVPSGTAIVRSDGVAYASVADASVISGTVTVPIAAVNAGAAGNFATNTTFRLANPIANIAPTSTGSTQTSPGADAELDDPMRTRMLIAYAAPPQGGDRQDYIEWALAIPGITRAWVAPHAMGAGTVSLYFMMDISEAAFGGFPQGTNGVAANETRDTTAAGDQLLVANALYGPAPVTALVYAVAPTAAPQAFTVSDLGSANTGANQTLITAALNQMFALLGQVGGTVDPVTGAAWPGIEPDAWYAAIEAIPGLPGFKVPVPSARITPGTGQLFTLGTVTFVT